MLRLQSLCGCPEASARPRVLFGWLLFVLVGLWAPAFAQAQSADLQVSAYTWSPDPVPNGAIATFVVTVHNNGPAAADNATVTIAVSPNFRVANNPGTDFPPYCALSGAVGSQTLSCTITPFGSGADLSFQYVALAAIVGAPQTSVSITAPGGVTDSNSANNVLNRNPTVKSGVDLRVTKSADQASYPGAATVTYMLQPINGGPDTSGAVRVTDQLPPPTDLSNVNASGTNWVCSILNAAGPNPTARCDYTGGTLIGNYPPITVTGRVALGIAGTITNSASIQSTSAQILENNPSNDSSGNIVVNVTPGADLAATTSMSATTIIGGTAQTITLRITNNGPATVTGAKSVAVIPADFTIGVLPAGCSQVGQTVTCTAGTLGGQQSFVIPVTAGLTPASGTNSSTVSPPVGITDPIAGNNTNSVGYAIVAPYADLSLAKSKSPNPVSTSGGTMTSTIVVTNQGISNADYTPATPIKIKDSLGANEQFTGVVTAGWSCSPAAPASGPVDILCRSTGTGTLAVSSSLTLVLTTAAINVTGPPYPTLSNTACTGGSAGSLQTPADNNASNDCAGAGSIATPRRTDLTVVKEVGPTAAGPWAKTLTVADSTNSYFYRLTISNAGPDDAPTVNASDVLPEYLNSSGFTTGVAFSGPDAAGCSNSGANVQCTLSNVVAGAGGARQIIVQVTRPVESGTFTNTASVSTPDSVETNLLNNSDTASPTIAPVADVTVTQKVVVPASVVVGVPVRYTISYRNSGPNPAANVVVTDVVDPTRFTYLGNLSNSAPSGAGACSFVAGTGTLTCNIGAMNRGDNYQIAFDVRAKFPFGGATTGFPISHTNTATISTTTLESDGSNNSGSVTHNVTQPQLDLIVVKKEPVGGDPVDFGANIVYLLRMQNDGPSRGTNMQVIDTPAPPGGYSETPISFSVVAGSTNAPGRTPTCTLNSPAAGQTTCVADATAANNYLDAGEYVTYQITFSSAGASPSTPLTYSNRGAVRSAESVIAGYDLNPSNNNVIETTTVLPVTELQALAKRTITPSPVNVNQATTFEVDARNNGPSTSPEFIITDTLPPGFQLVGTPTAIAAGAASVSAVSCTGTTIVRCDLTGTFPPGNVNVVTLSLQARPVYPYGGVVGSPVINAADVSIATDSGGNPLARDPNNANNHVTSTVTVQASSLAGVIYADDNRNDAYTAGEELSGVTVTLSGTDSYGNSIFATANSNGSGAYTFAALPPGTYQLVETQPGGFLDSAEFAGTAGGTASPNCPPAGNCGAAAAQNQVTGIGLGANTAATGYNFQEYRPAQVSGFVYVDANNNGQRGGGETGVNGAVSPVTIRISGTDYAGNAVNTTQAINGSGAYTFANLAPSDALGYTITEVNEPSGYVDGLDQNGAGAGNVIAASAGRAVGETIVVGVVNGGANLSERNFGELQAVTLAGTVYVDVNGNSSRQAGENAGVSGTTVALTGTNDLGQAINCSLQTDSVGAYSFPIAASADPLCRSLRPGVYALAMTTPTGLTLTGAYSGSAGGGGQPANTALPGQSTVNNISLSSGATGSNYNFGVQGQGIAGSVYLDRNGNGTRNAGEVGIPGVTVTLSGTTSGGQNVCVVINPSPCTVTTDANGNFNFLNIPASNASGYTLTEQAQNSAPLTQFQDGLEAVGTINGTTVGTAGNDVISGIVIATGQIGTGYTFGELGGSLAGFNYIDANNNGVFDGGETPIAGVTVTLSGTTVSGANVCTVVASCTAVSAADGSYSFPDMPAGAAYTLTQTQPANYGDGIDTPGTVGGSPSGTAGGPGTSVISGIALPTAGTGINFNFGETVGGLSGRVCVDVANDACQAGDPGLGGVTITLSGVDGAGNAVNRSTTTAADGSYSFAALPTPNATGYTLTKTQPAGYGSTAVNTSVGTAGGSGSNNLITGIALPGSGTASGYNFGETQADLALTKSVAPLRQLVGQNVTFTVTVRNNGPTIATGVTVSDPLPAGLTFVSATPGAGSSFAGNTWTIGSLANGAATQLTLTARVAVPGPYANTAQVATSNMPDPNSPPGNNNAAENDQATATVVPLVSVTGHVFHDPNGNGVQEAGETPFAGVAVQVTDSTGVVTTVTTDLNGDYIANVAPGPATLNVTDPAGVSLTTANDPQTVNVLLQVPPTASSPVGFQPLGTITGTVFADLNGNAVKDPGEPPYANQPVVITTALGGTITVNTDANGQYSTPVPAGNTSPNVTDPANTTLTTANDPHTVVVPTGGVGVATPVGFRPLGPDLTVTKTHAPATFTESNAGIYTITVRNIGANATTGRYTIVDTLPQGMSVAQLPTGTGWNCAATTLGAATATCDSSVVVNPGTAAAPITLIVNVAAGSAARSPLVNNVAVSGGGEVPAFANNNTATDSTPVQLAAAVSGSVWFDTGSIVRQRDPGDQALVGWIAELVDPALPAGSAPVRTAPTDANGNYLIGGVTPGNYLLQFRDPATGIVFGTPVNGNNGNPQSGSQPAPTNPRGALQVTLVAGQTLLQQSLPVDPSGIVYDSVARTPVANAVVSFQPTTSCAGWNPATQVVNASGGGYTVTGSAITMTTASNGFYQFLLGPNAPASCTFTLSVTPPVQYLAPSTLIPSAPSLSVPAAPGTLAVQPQPAVPVGSQSTTYYLTLVTGSAAQNVIHNHIPIDPRVPSIVSIEKLVNDKSAEIGDSLLYTIRVHNVQGANLPGLLINDSLPLGFSYLPGSSRLQLASAATLAAADPAGGAGPRLVFSYNGVLATGQTLTLTYRARVGIGAQNGDGTNRARAQSGVITTNEARVTVKVSGGVFTTEACVEGKIWLDCNENQIQDPEEVGVPGVRLYFEDGTYLISDSEGKYSYCGLKPITHVLKADRTTLPKGAYLGTTGSRNAGDPDSLFVDLRAGELHRADFRITSCTNEVRNQVFGRRSKGEVIAPEVEKGSPKKPDVSLDPRHQTRCNLPRQANSPVYEGTPTQCPAPQQEGAP